MVQDNPDFLTYFRSWNDPMHPRQVTGIRTEILHLSQAELGALFGVSPTTVSRWEDKRFAEGVCKAANARLLYLLANDPTLVDTLRTTAPNATPEPTNNPFNFGQYSR